MIYAESGGNPKAKSSAGARGLMQIVPKWHPECKINRLLEPEYNVKCGTRILANSIAKHGLREGLDRYYRGTINKSRWYSSLILSLMRRLTGSS